MGRLCLFLLLFTALPVRAQSWSCTDALMAFKQQKAHLDAGELRKMINAIISRALAADSLECACDAYRSSGILFRDELHYDSAMAAYVNSRLLADSLNYFIGFASTCNQVASLYYDLGADERAMAYFRLAREAYKKGHEKIRFRGLADVSFNMALLSAEKDSLKQAERLCLESIYYWRQFGKTDIFRGHYCLLSDITRREEHLPQANTYLQLAEANGGLDEKDDIALLLQRNALASPENQADSSIGRLKRAYALALDLGDRRYAATLAGQLGEALKVRQPDSALHYQQISADYKTALSNDLMLATVAENETRYGLYKKDMELARQEHLVAEAHTTSLIFVIISLFLAFGIVVLSWIFVQKRRIRLRESQLDHVNAMLHGQDVERERIARDLHDRVGSMLSTVKLHFSAMEEQMDEMIRLQGKSYGKAIDLLDETYEEVRRISHDLDSGLLSRFGFKAAVLHLAQVLESTNRLKVLYLDNNLDPAVYQAFATDLYRITQELLSNTIKYAQASQVSIQLSQDQGNLVYSYEDDGRGFDKNQLQHTMGIGYKNIDGRVKKMKGKWHLDSSPGHGLNMIIELPLNG